MIKNIILITIIFPSILFGQVVNHFENINSNWNVAKTYPNTTQQNPTFVETTTTIYGFQGDTVVNSEQWFKLYSTKDSLFQNNLLYLGLLREENNKVYYLDTLNQLDTLYDFSLDIGDSVLFDVNGTNPEWLEVLVVDSMLINGDYHKRLEFAEPSFSAFDELNEIWIEGIGSIHGPLFPNNPIKFSGEMPDSMLLTCSFSNNQQFWQHPYYQDCYVSNSLSLDNLKQIEFNVYPNPFTNTIHFDNTGLHKFKLTLLNELGQEIKQIEINSEIHSFDLTDLNAGVYFFKIESNEVFKIVKMIKKH